MSKTNRSARRRNQFRLESLEDRSLLSTLISAKPTLEVMPQGHRVREVRGAIYITQPTPIAVTGTATPASSHASSVVEIYAKDANGNLVNNGAPLATAKPDFSGQYNATLSLPSRLRGDVNTLFAREVASGTFVSRIQIDPTTISGLQGDLAVNGTNLNDLTATIANPATNGTVNGSILTPSTPITNIGGQINLPAFPVNLGGVTGTAGPAVGDNVNIPSFPISLNGASGTAGPVVGTMLGGSGTLDPQVAIISGGTVSTDGSTSNLTDGTGAIDPTTGTFTQTGTADVAATTGTSTLQISEVAVSEPITVVIHQSQRVPGAPIQLQARTGPRALMTEDGAGARVQGMPTGPRAFAARAPAGRALPGRGFPGGPRAV